MPAMKDHAIFVVRRCLSCALGVFDEGLVPAPLEMMCHCNVFLLLAASSENMHDRSSFSYDVSAGLTGRG